jgi:hypothetical protein
MPREKPERGARLKDLPGRHQRGDRARDRETEILRELVRVLAREAAREAFEQALAEQQDSLEDDT